MLRTKQISTISHTARSLFLGGSRCSTADGASSTHSEDEACIPRRQSTCVGARFSPKASSLASGANVVKEGIPCPVDATISVRRSTARSCVHQVPASHLLPAVNSFSRSDNANSFKSTLHSVDIDAPTQPDLSHSSKLTAERLVKPGGSKVNQQDLSHSSKLVTERLAKAGAATVGLLSDVVKHKFPVPDCGSVLLATQNCVVDFDQPVSNVKSSAGKSRKRNSNPRVQSRSSVGITGGYKSSIPSHIPKGKAEISHLKDVQNIPNKIEDTCVDSNRVPLDKTNGRYPRFQGAKPLPRSVFSGIKSGRKISKGKVEALAESIRVEDKLQRPTCSTMVNVGPFLSAQSSGHLVGRVYHTLCQIKSWGPAAAQKLHNLGCTLDPYQANQVLKQLQDYTVAFGFFYWLKHQPGFRHDNYTYTTMIGILGRAKQFGTINSLLEEMIMDGCEPNVVTYNRLIHSFGLANYIDKAIETFYHMQNVGIRPDRVTYCTLIDMHAKAGFLEVAMDVYQMMQKVGLTPDTFTYSLMINCLGKAGHLSVAYKLFCEMVSRGLVPNLVTYNILIALQAKARNFPSALKLYREMQAAGFHPDKITYSIIMEVLGHCGFLDEAESLFVEMKRKEWIPDEHVYGLLVDLWGKAGNVDKARGWYQLMLDSGLRPNVPTCNSLLSAFLRMHRFSDANDVLQTMLNFGLHPSLQTYTLLLSCCTEARSPIDMGSCGKLMAVTGHPAHNFLLTLPAAEPGGQNVRDHTGIFLDLMHSENRESKRGLVDAVIDFLHKSGLKEEAGSIWEVAAKRNVYPDAVREKRNSYWLINLHVMSDGTAVTALSRTLASFRKQILTSGVGPNRIDIITGWGRRSRVTGTSLVRQSVQELLHLFRFPFFKEYGNSGCFVGCGESLNQWLLHSYVERMHLL